MSILGSLHTKGNIENVADLKDHDQPETHQFGPSRSNLAPPTGDVSSAPRARQSTPLQQHHRTQTPVANSETPEPDRPPRRSATKRTPQYDLEAAWDPLNPYLTDSEPEDLGPPQLDGAVETSLSYHKNLQRVDQLDDPYVHVPPCSPAVSQASTAPTKRRARTCSSDSSSSDEYLDYSDYSETGRAGSRSKKNKRRTGQTNGSAQSKKRKRTSGLNLKRKDVVTLVDFIAEQLDWQSAANRLRGGVRIPGVRGPLAGITGVLADPNQDPKVETGLGSLATELKGLEREVNAMSKDITREDLKTAWIEELGAKLIGNYKI
ncbi:MAG: hypothetical protein MMC23_001386 [Stictis urceolatum]|nr:hypothetical protein [Stictis urceolata]